MKKAFLIFLLLVLSPGLVYGQNAEIHKAAYNWPWGQVLLFDI